LESRWGRNVADYGFGSMGVTRCARILDVTGALVLTNRERDDGTQDWWLYAPDLGILEMVPFLFTPSAVGSFPYGVAVEPNVPL